jgi:hypothetical protein
VKEAYTKAELLHLARLKFHHAPTSLILRELGRHTESSIDMAWANLRGDLPNASERMREVADELDGDPYFEGWRI